MNLIRIGGTPLAQTRQSAFTKRGSHPWNLRAQIIQGRSRSAKETNRNAWAMAYAQIHSSTTEAPGIISPNGTHSRTETVPEMPSRNRPLDISILRTAAAVKSPVVAPQTETVTVAVAEGKVGQLVRSAPATTLINPAKLGTRSALQAASDELRLRGTGPHRLPSMQ
jgi:hypothetical protein